MSVIVKSNPDAMVYTRSGWRIPSDTFVEVDATAGVIKAIMSGDLEEAERIEDEAVARHDAERLDNDEATAARGTVNVESRVVSEPDETDRPD